MKKIKISTVKQTCSVNDFLKTPAGLRALLGSCNKACWNHIDVERAVQKFIETAKPTCVFMKVRPELAPIPIFVYVPTLDDIWAVDPYDVANAVVEGEFWQTY